MNKMRIEIWSDIACPFCYIGKRKLEMALDKFEHKDKVELIWHSYQLDPSLPKKDLGVSIYEYMAKYLNVSIEEAKAKQKGLADIAKTVKLNYDFDKLVVTNTGDALRLAKLAAESGVATEAEEAIFEAYFVDGKNISDRSTLIQLGEKVGLKKADIEAMLDSEKYYDQIKQDLKYANEELKLEFIPYYRLNNNQTIQGSIEVDDYLKALNQAFADWESGKASDSDVITGQSCSIDGVCS